MALHDWNADHAPVRSFDFGMPHDLFVGVVAAFDENVGQHARHHPQNRLVVEYRHVIHRRQHLRTLHFRLQEVVRSLRRAHAAVAVHSNNEYVSELACLLEQARVAGVEQVETTIRKNCATATALELFFEPLGLLEGH